MPESHITRRKFIKLSAVAVGSAAAVPILSACAAPAAAPKAAAPAAAANVVSSAAKKIKVIQAADFVEAGDNMLKQLMAEWGKANGYEVEIEIVASPSLPAKIAAAMTVQAGPDLIQIKEGDAWINAHSLVDVTTTVEKLKAKLGALYPTVEAHTKVNGVYRVIPFSCTPQGWIYRTDWFADAGFKAFPTTMDEFMAAGKKLKAAGHPIGVTLGANNGDARSFCYSVMWNMGGMELDPSGKVILNSPETAKGLEWAQEFLKTACDPGGFGWDESGNNRAYAAKTVACINNAPSVYVNALKNDAELGKVTALAASVPGPGGAFFNFGTKNYGIPKWSQQQDAVQAMIAWMAQPEQFNKFIPLAGGQNCGPYAYYKDNPGQPFKDDPKLVPFLKVFQQGRWEGYAGSPDARSALARQQDAIVNMFSKVNSGVAIKDAVTSAETLLKQIYV